MSTASIDRVSLVARLDGSVGVLVQAGAKPDVVHRLGVVIEAGNDVGAVLGEGIGLTLDPVRREDHEASAMFLERLAPLNQLGEVFLAGGRVGELHGRVRGHKRDAVLGEERCQGPLGVPVVNDRRKRFKPVEPKRRHVANRGGQVIGSARHRAPDQRGAADPQPARLLRAQGGGQQTSANPGEDVLAEGPSIDPAVHDRDSSSARRPMGPKGNRIFRA